jgi:hypothetical protein
MKVSWPVLDGAYVVGDADAPVAVCTLTSEALIEPLAPVAGVAIAGKVYTANLGIERIVVNVTSNPAIRFLLLCGKDSKLFRPGQSLSALVDNGIDPEARIVGGDGYDRYDQDRPLRRMSPKPAPVDGTACPAVETAAKPPMPRISPPLTLDQLSAASQGEVLSAVLQVTKQSSESEFGGTFLQPSERDPFSSFQRTDHPLTISTTSETKTIMGAPSDVVPGAIIRVQGVLRPGDRVDAQAVVILTNVASVQ